MGDLNDTTALAGQDAEKPLSDATRAPRKIRTPYIYEGTDSGDDDDEILLSRRVKAKQSSSSSPSYSGPDNGDPLTDFKEYQLQQGELASESENFVSWQAIKKYPWSYIGVTNRKIVANNFFDGGQIYQNIWDFFYLYRLPQDSSQKPILLVPSKQFECLLRSINDELRVQLRIPSGSNYRCGFRVKFPNDGTPRPRYLGRAMDRAAADKLHENIPPSHFMLASEPRSIRVPSNQSIAIFKEKMDTMVRANKQNKAVKNQRKQVQRAVQKEEWNESIQKVQRYLGLRGLSLAQQGEIIRAKLQNENLRWMDYDEAFRKEMSNAPPTIEFDSRRPAPYDHGDSIVFVCVDVEANERNTRQITEIGIATLDTEDLKAIDPGHGGVFWRDLIRARHFRIKENKHIINKAFVHGCPDQFVFGESEFISLKDAPHAISSCFKHPFSKKNTEASVDNGQKRNIVLVGHDVQADVRFLRTIGYDVNTLSNLVDTADTSLMWRYLQEEINPRNLAAILAELGIEAWHLHNGGNDAVYTLQAMLGIVIKALIEEQEKTRKEEELEMVSRKNTMAMKLAGWFPPDYEDGGARQSPILPEKAEQNAVAQSLVTEYLEKLHIPEHSKSDGAPQSTIDPKAPA